MKKSYYLLFIALFMMTVNNSVFGQPNSVELQNGGGVLISSHSSIEEAYNAIPAAILQAYIIEILTAYTGANEVFPIDLTLKTGHSAANTITIRPDAGNTGESIVSTNTNGIISIEDADYIIIDGRPGGTGTSIDLLIYNTATTGAGSNTIEFNNGATNCVLRYCNVKSNISGTAGPRNVIFGTSAANVTGNSDNLVEHCTLDGSRSGVASSGTAANPNRGNVILNCSIINFSYAGIWWLGGTTDLTVTGCTISSNGSSDNTIVSGIIASPTADNSTLTFTRNKVVNMNALSTSTSLAVRGVYISGSPGTGSVVTIENNFVALTSNYNSATIVFGIFTVGSLDPHIMNVYYNSVLIGGTQTGGLAGRTVSSGIVKQSTAPGIVYNQKNNISINNRTGGTLGVIHSGGAINESAGILDIDYNCYFSATGNHASWDSVNYLSLASYKAAASPNEQNSVFKNVNFVSNNDLHLTGASIGDPDLIGTPIAGITTDIDNQPRSATAPYKGADEPLAIFFSTLNLKINLQACSPMRDTITVLLRDTASPYIVIDSARGVIDSNGAVSLSFTNAVNGARYYIVVKHRNSIETWSRAGGELFTGGVLNYDFTVAASQAFGNNQILVNGKWSIYTGDVQQDGVVDGSDGALIDNDAFNFVSGYVATDLNCDSIVDGSDAAFADNNAANFVAISRP